ncbi:MAG: efflux RND transporter permease subunit [Ancrocorticia sp.]
MAQHHSPAHGPGMGQTRRWARVLVPALIVLLWVAIAGVGGPLFGRIDEVSSNEPTAYLPESAESTEVSVLSREFYDSDEIPAVALIVSDDGVLSQSDIASVTKVVQGLGSLKGVGALSPPIPSEDGAAVQVFVPVDPSSDIADTVTAVRGALTEDLPNGLTPYVTGPAGLSADLVEAFGGIDGILLAVALLAVFIILLVVYRSLLLPLIVLITSLFALCGALATVWFMAREGLFLLNGQTQGILFILVIGAATDYSLLYVSRYREALTQNEKVVVATRRAWRATLEPVLASGGTVIAGLLCLLLSDLKSNSVLGPVTAMGIVFAMLAALSLLPSALALCGRAAFWPRRPTYDPEHGERAHVDYSGVWGRTVRWVERNTRAIWIVTTCALLVGAFAAIGFRAGGVAQSELVLGTSQARDGQEALAQHFPGGSGSPAVIIADSEDADAVVALLTDSSGVASVAIITADSPSGQAPISPEGIVPVGPPGTPPPTPTEVGGKVLLQATLSNPADSDAAIETIVDLRAELKDAAPGTLVGGTTATNLDTVTASVHDRNLIIPIVLAVILVILMALLRAVVAPILLILTTILSFGTAMGVAAVIFNHILRFPGADPAVPLYSFVFLVALGIDYNIFLMTRVREESKQHGTHEGIIRGLAVTGTVITSAGIVLAATFAALAVIPILFLAQLAFIVSFGVLLDTFIVRTLLVPALALDIGRPIWWPSKLAKAKE